MTPVRKTGNKHAKQNTHKASALLPVLVQKFRQTSPSRKTNKQKPKTHHRCNLTTEKKPGPRASEHRAEQQQACRTDHCLPQSSQCASHGAEEQSPRPEFCSRRDHRPQVIEENKAGKRLANSIQQHACSMSLLQRGLISFPHLFLETT